MNNLELKDLEKITSLIDWEEYNYYKNNAIKRHPEISSYLANETTVYPHIFTFVKLNKLTNFLEFGTREGALASILSLITKVTTFDIYYGHWHAGNIPIYKIKVESDDFHLQNMTEFDGIFIDVSHNGTDENLIHQNLIQNYHGVVLYDDIGYKDYEEMNNWWERVSEEKIRLDWHNNYFGAIKY